jgi:hypothetical protein
MERANKTKQKCHKDIHREKEEMLWLFKVKLKYDSQQIVKYLERPACDSLAGAGVHLQ